MKLKDLTKMNDFEKDVFFFNDDGEVLTGKIFSVTYSGKEIDKVRIVMRDQKTIYEVPAELVYTDAEDHPKIIKKVISGIDKQIDFWLKLREHYISMLENEKDVFNKF